MSKNDPTDKSTYTFARLALGKFGHGKITFDTDSMTTCPHCNKEYNFGRQKVLNLEPKNIQAVLIKISFILTGKSIHLLKETHSQESGLS